MNAPAAEVTASYIRREINLNSEHSAAEWALAAPMVFSQDWQGRNGDLARETQVKILWSDETLFLRFVCRYRKIFVFTDSDACGRRNQLWDRDVAEAFLQPDPSQQACYKEFEVSPNGMWLDLDVSPGGVRDLKSELHRSVFLDPQAQTWTAEMAIPIGALTRNFNPEKPWRANFYRVEGPKEPRTYLAWQPTMTPQPNFHVAAKFGILRFLKDGAAW